MLGLLRRVGHSLYAVWDTLTYWTGRFAIVIGCVATGAYAGFLAYLLAKQVAPYPYTLATGVVAFLVFAIMALIGVGKIISGDWRG